jgi:hypothetical protein
MYILRLIYMDIEAFSILILLTQNIHNYNYYKIRNYEK